MITMIEVNDRLRSLVTAGNSDEDTQNATTQFLKWLLKRYDDLDDEAKEYVDRVKDEIEINVRKGIRLGLRHQ